MSSPLSGGELSGGAAEAVDAGLAGGSPKHHMKVMRKDGTHYWRRTKSAMRRGFLHHREKMRRKSAKRSGKKRSTKKRSAKK
jgi:hypothetical protein